MNHYTAALFLPHTQLNLFPTVLERVRYLQQGKP